MDNPGWMALEHHRGDDDGDDYEARQDLGARLVGVVFWGRCEQAIENPDKIKMGTIVLVGTTLLLFVVDA